MDGDGRSERDAERTKVEQSRTLEPPRPRVSLATTDLPADGVITGPLFGLV